MFERFAFGVDAEEGFDDRTDDHQDGADEVADKQRRFRTGADDPAEEDWSPYSAGQGAEGVEDGNREGANLEGKDFAYG